MLNLASVQIKNPKNGARYKYRVFLTDLEDPLIDFQKNLQKDFLRNKNKKF